MNDHDFVIDVSGIAKRFGDKTVVNGIDLQVKRGEIYGFLGPNHLHPHAVRLAHT
jgi:ABC-2 type transport system ATP-binding protein